MICSKPLPASDMMVSSSSSPGNAIQASTTRCTAMSTLPPMNPEPPPTRIATSTLIVVADSPTSIEMRAP